MQNSTPRKFNFTLKALEAVKLPPGKDRMFVYDTGTPGLALRVTAAGGRSFYYYRSQQGRPVKLHLGDYPDLTIEQARNAAAVKNGERAQKVDLSRVNRERKREFHEASTLADMWGVYHATVTKSPRSKHEDEGNWRRYLEPWGADRRVKEIRVEDVQTLYKRIAGGELNRELKGADGKVRTIHGGPIAANRCMALLSGMFSECGRQFGVPGYNPCSEVRKIKEHACDRYLSEAELPAFWQAMGQQGELTQDLIKLALFTAQRRSNLREMAWGEVNLTFGVWTIPAHKMKGRKAHTVPLVPAAVEILKRRQEAGGKEAVWVLASPESSTGHIQDPKKAMAAVSKAAGIAPVTLHDLRRTCATWMNSTGASESTIAAVLAHSRRNVTGIYAKATEDAKREALTKAVEAMLKAVGAAAVEAQATAQAG